MPKFVPGSGPSPATIALLGEAPGNTENLYGRPFIGEAGEELNRMLAEVGLDRKSCYVTNVFKYQPPGNDVNHFFVSRTDPEADTTIPSRNGKYLRLEFRQQYDDVLGELVGVAPKLVIALGATALWRLLGYSKISAYVGTLHPPTRERPFYVLPTFHPAAVLRQWSYRSTVVANLTKAETFIRETGSVNSPNEGGVENRFSLKTNPTLVEVKRFAARASLAPEMAVDIETARGQIRTIAFCIDPDSAFCIPFWEPPGGRYWPDTGSEVAAWNCVREILASPGRKIFHNGAFDLQYLWRGMGIPVGGRIEDTMLLHHALEPELPKGLGHLAATYLNIPEWKQGRTADGKDED